jgi:hypothetical protein
MRPVERLEKLIKERRYKANAETYNKTLDSFLQAVDGYIKQKTARLDPYIWRKIMASRITKLAAAAVIIITVYVVIHQSGGSIDIATVAFAQITENMKNMPWLHAVVEGEQALGTEMVRDKMEGWFCFERKITVSKQGSGEVRFQDDLKQILQFYDPATDTITISYVTPLQWNKIGGSALDFPKAVMKMFEDAGEKVARETGKYKGKDTLIFKMSAFLGGMDMNVEMTVDAKMHIVLFINQKAFDKAGKLIMESNAHFDYPETGPETIYDVGVPKSAKTVHGEKEEERIAYEKAFKEAVSVIDSRKSWHEPRELVISYWQHRNAKDYDEIAILWPGSSTWNRHALEKEEPVEYVFGEVQKGSAEGLVVVPYASKDYYEKHGKYSLKMRLSKEKSTKGRYYIVSGN